VTVSMGVTEFGGDRDDTLQELLHRADRALYQAKERGRNRVVIWKKDMG
jgi:diguanylate cyclase (GGDEF)-like protein